MTHPIYPSAETFLLLGVLWRQKVISGDLAWKIIAWGWVTNLVARLILDTVQP